MPKPRLPRLYIVGFVFFIASCALLNLFHGYSPTDDGFILAGAWRIFNGQIPYRDFIYVRPPLSQYLHTIWFWFPERWVFSLARASYYLWMGALLVVPVTLLAPRLVPAKTLPFVSLFTLSAWLVALHNFPPMPWHTVDGLLFATLGVMLFGAALVQESPSVPFLIISAICAGLAPLAKQNFALIPVWYAGAAFVAWRFHPAFRWFHLVWAGICGAFPLIMMGGYLQHEGVLNEALSQIRGASQGSVLWDVGIEPYLHLARIPLIVLCGALGWVSVTTARRWLLWIPLVAFPIFFIEFSWHQNLNRSIPFFLGLSVWTVAFATRWSLTTKSPLRLPMWILLSGAIATAWASSVSWGYFFPFLAFTMLGFMVAVLLGQRQEILDKTLFHIGLAASSFVVCGACYVYISWQMPYREVPRAQQTADAAQIFPRLGWKLTTNPELFERLTSLQTLEARARVQWPEKKLVVAPQFPLFYFLTRQTNPMRIDWWLPTDYSGKEALLARELQSPDLGLLVETTDATCRTSIMPDPLMAQVLTHGKVLDRQGTFCLVHFPLDPMADQQ